MGKRLCLTFSVYYFVHPYNITALMICQHVFLNIYIFYRKIVTENGVNSNESSVFSLLYIQYFLHIRAIIKVSQQFITTQPLHEIADKPLHTSFLFRYSFSGVSFSLFCALYCTFYTHTSDKITCFTTQFYTMVIHLRKTASATKLLIQLHQ